MALDPLRPSSNRRDGYLRTPSVPPATGGTATLEPPPSSQQLAGRLPSNPHRPSSNWRDGSSWTPPSFQRLVGRTLTPRHSSDRASAPTSSVVEYSPSACRPFTGRAGRSLLPCERAVDRARKRGADAGSALATGVARPRVMAGHGGERNHDRRCRACIAASASTIGRITQRRVMPR